MRVNMTRTVGIDGTKIEDLTKAEVEERRRSSRLQSATALGSGFERSIYLYSGRGGVRRPQDLGDYILTEDVQEAESLKTVPRGYTMDIHDPEGGPNTTPSLEMDRITIYRMDVCCRRVWRVVGSRTRIY